jgi:HK97 family phage portal protein
MMPNAFMRWLERRVSVTTLARPSPAFWQLFESGPTASGQVVDATTALQVPAVFSCIQVLAQDLARTPIRFRQKTGPDTFVDAADHDLFDLLNSLPNPEMTAFTFKHFLQWQLLVHGKAFAEIVRVDGRVTALWPLDAASMRVDRDASLRKRWTYTAGGQPFVWLFEASMPPILELTMETPLLRCREIIGSALALQSYTANFFKNNARPQGVIQAPHGIADTTADALKAAWATNYGGASNRGKVAVLEGGVEFKPIAMENDAAQLNETMRAINEQIAGVFRVPVWKIGDLSKANYSNMESGQLTYTTDTLDPLFELWEEALRRDLLTSRQWHLYTMAFDRQALVRNDIRSLNASLQSGIQNGYLSQNEARKALGLNPIPDGDTYMVNTALQPVGALREVPGVA